MYEDRFDEDMYTVPSYGWDDEDEGRLSPRAPTILNSDNDEEDLELHQEIQPVDSDEDADGQSPMEVVDGDGVVQKRVRKKKEVCLPTLPTADSDTDWQKQKTQRGELRAEIAALRGVSESQARATLLKRKAIQQTASVTE